MARTRILDVCTVTLTLEIWPWVKVMTHPWVMDNNFVKYYPDPTWQWGVMARTRISCICALWPWRYDLGSRLWHILRSWTISVWNIIQIQLGSEELWPGHGFPVYVHRDLDLGDMTLGQGHAHPCVMDINCVKCYPDQTWQWGDTQIFGKCTLWPWPMRYDLGSRAWHTLGSWITIMWNDIQIWQGERSYGPTMWTEDRQTDRVIPIIYHRTLLGGGGGRGV